MIRLRGLRPAAAGAVQPAAPRRRTTFRQAALMLMMLLMAALVGIAAGLGSLYLSVLIGSLMIVPWVLLMPTTWLVGILVFMAVVGAGCLQYFARVGQAHWIPTLLLATLLVRAAFDSLRVTPRAPSRPTFGALAICLIAFAVLVVVSALVNASDPMQVLVGFRHYIFPLALVVAVLTAGASLKYWAQMARGVPCLMVLQLPLCLYQYFFVEKARGAKVFGAVGIAWDAVVGSFGGNPDGGGASGALAVFLSFGLAYTLVLRREGLISRRLAGWAVFAAVVSCLLAEIKVIVVFVPLSMLLVYRRSVLRSPVILIGWLVGILAMTGVLLAAYQFLHYGASTKRYEQTWSDKLDEASHSETDLRFYNRLTGEVSRVGGLVLWADENLVHAFGPQALVGWGPAASKTSTLFGAGPAARTHQYNLTTSSGTQLLWDLGLGGFGAFGLACVLALVSGVREAARLRPHAAAYAALGEFCALGCLIGLAGLLYNGDAINNPAVQILLALCMGLGLWLPRQQPGPAASARPARGLEG